MPASVAIAEVARAERPAVQMHSSACVLDVHYEKAFSTDIHARGTDALRRAGIARPVVGAVMTTPAVIAEAETAVASAET
jgi:hypothetical protein